MATTSDTTQTTSPKPLMIRGDRLLLALNVLEVSSWPIESWRAQPERLEIVNPLRLDVKRTQQMVEETMRDIRSLLYGDHLRRKLFPFLAANPSGIAAAQFSIEAVAEHFTTPDCYKPSAWRDDIQKVRAFLTRFASGELTEADFKE